MSWRIVMIKTSLTVIEPLSPIPIYDLSQPPTDNALTDEQRRSRFVNTNCAYESTALLSRILADHSHVRMLSPMVRYSKLPFRLLARQYGADIAFTPMIVARAFNKSSHARFVEWQTTAADRPLIAQFATDDPLELVGAAQRVTAFVDGVDINCGCPQGWAIKQNIGGALISKPQLIAEMVRAVRTDTTLPISIKIRVHADIRHTVDLVRQAEKAGVAWITVHGRTVYQKNAPADWSAIQTIKSVCSVPIIANGDINNPDAVIAAMAQTNADGYMSARGALSNPTLFNGHKTCSLNAVTDYIHYAIAFGGRYSIHHHHIAYMLADYLSRGERRELMQLRSMSSIIAFCVRRGWWHQQTPLPSILQPYWNQQQESLANKQISSHHIQSTEINTTWH